MIIQYSFHVSVARATDKHWRDLMDHLVFDMVFTCDCCLVVITLADFASRVGRGRWLHLHFIVLPRHSSSTPCQRHFLGSVVLGLHLLCPAYRCRISADPTMAAMICDGVKVLDAMKLSRDLPHIVPQRLEILQHLHMMIMFSPRLLLSNFLVLTEIRTVLPPLRVLLQIVYGFELFSPFVWINNYSLPGAKLFNLRIQKSVPGFDLCLPPLPPCWSREFIARLPITLGVLSYWEIIILNLLENAILSSWILIPFASLSRFFVFVVREIFVEMKFKKSARCFATYTYVYSSLSEE